MTDGASEPITNDGSSVRDKKPIGEEMALKDRLLSQRDLPSGGAQRDLMSSPPQDLNCPPPARRQIRDKRLSFQISEAVTGRRERLSPEAAATSNLY